MASKSTCKYVKPILSTNPCEAKRRVLGLYRAWYRYIPHIVKNYDIPKNEEQCRRKLRESFYKNACVTDIRVIDILIVKGYMELNEVINIWQQKGHLMTHFKPTAERMPKTFLEKFVAGVE